MAAAVVRTTVLPSMIPARPVDFEADGRVAGGAGLTDRAISVHVDSPNAGPPPISCLTVKVA